MSKIKWDQDGERFYETGTKCGVLYPKTGENGAYGNGVPWNGLTAVSEKPSGAEPNPLYADDIKYLNLISNEEFSCTIEAYTYPDEFAQCDGSIALTNGVVITQQPRKPFGFSYRTAIGNDTEGTDKGYKLHLVYGCMAAPTEKSYATVNDSPEAITFSWEVTTTPVEINVSGANYKPTAHLIIDSTKADVKKLKALEDILYGKDGDGGTAAEPRLPLPAEVISILSEAA